MCSFFANRSSSSNSRLMFIAVVLSALLTGLEHGHAQGNKKPPPKPVVEDVDLETSDGVQLTATFYHGTNGKESVPVIILPAWKGERSEYKDLAGYLQQTSGHAVIVPDLRGHGDSDRQVVGADTIEIDAAKFKGPELQYMWQRDMEAIKEFLLQKHIAAVLNINKLFVVGIKESCLLAQYWAAHDWNRRPKWQAPRWNGEIVKGLVLVSPLTNFRIKRTGPNLQYTDPLRTEAVSKILSIMIIVGNEDKQPLAKAKQYQSKFKPFRPPPPKDRAQELQTFFFMEKETTLQGEQLVNLPALKVHGLINGFVSHRASKTKAPWKAWIPAVGGP
jgi:pimeloyl-ACP methyl ester carboxylesterase